MRNETFNTTTGRWEKAKPIPFKTIWYSPHRWVPWVVGLTLLVIAIRSAAAQPPYHPPEKPPEVAQTDFNGNGVPDASDDQLYLNKKAVAMSWYRDVTGNAPGQPVRFLAAAAGPTVSLSWTNDSRPQTAVYILRNGALVSTLAGTATSTTDTPGGGTWLFSVTTGNAVVPYLYAPLGTAPTASVTVQGMPPPPTSGWTDLTPPAGARALYTTASGTGTACTQASPCALSQGLSLLRDGFPDQLLLKCGDTFTLADQITLTKSAKSASQYMVIGSYGTGPRPVIKTPGNGIYGGNNSGQHNGLAIVGLDLSPIAMTAGADGIILLSTNGAAWDQVLVEDCYIHGYSANIVMQTLVDGHTFTGTKIRRNIVADADNNGSGHAEGCFIGGAISMVIEENLFDNNARAKADMFCHGVYLSEVNGISAFDRNILSRNCSHGVQQRSGGWMRDNLALQNPIGLFQGDRPTIGAGMRNVFAYNVAIDSRDINASDTRGFGFWINGGPLGADVTYNIAAHQDHGTANCEGFQFDGIHGGTVMGNFAYDWHCPTIIWGHSYTFGDTSVTFTGNRSAQPRGGVFISGSNSGSSVGNTDYGQGSYDPLVQNLHTEAYMAHLNRTGGLGEFVGECRKQSKQNWRPEFTASGFNTWARGIMGVSQPPAP